MKKIALICLCCVFFMPFAVFSVFDAESFDACMARNDQAACASIQKELTASFATRVKQLSSDTQARQVNTYAPAYAWLDEVRVEQLCDGIRINDKTSIDLSFKLFFMVTDNHDYRMRLSKALNLLLEQDPVLFLTAVSKVRADCPATVTDAFFFSSLSGIISNPVLFYYDENGYRELDRQLSKRKELLEKTNLPDNNKQLAITKEKLLLRLKETRNGLGHTKYYIKENFFSGYGPITPYAALVKVGFSNWEMIADDRWPLAVASDVAMLGIIANRSENVFLRRVGGYVAFTGTMINVFYPFYATVESYFSGDVEQRQWGWIGVMLVHPYTLMFLFREDPSSENNNKVFGYEVIFTPVAVGDYAGIDARLVF